MSGMRIKGFQLVPQRSIQLNETEVLMLALTASYQSTTAVKVPIPVHMQLAVQL